MERLDNIALALMVAAALCGVIGFFVCVAEWLDCGEVGPVAKSLLFGGEAAFGGLFAYLCVRDRQGALGE